MVNKDEYIGTLMGALTTAMIVLHLYKFGKLLTSNSGVGVYATQLSTADIDQHLGVSSSTFEVALLGTVQSLRAGNTLGSAMHF